MASDQNQSAHPSTFIDEELAARGWSRADLAARMGEDAGRNLLVLDMYAAIGPNDPRMQLGQQTADQLAAAFGVPAEFFLNLETAWRRSAVR